MKPSNGLQVLLPLCIQLFTVGLLLIGVESVQEPDDLVWGRDSSGTLVSVPLNRTEFVGLMRVSVIVRDESGRPADGIIVSIKGLSNNLSTTQLTDRNGSVLFNVPKGTYEFTLSSNSLGKKTKIVRVITKEESVPFTYTRGDERPSGRIDLVLLGLLLSGAVLQMSFSTGRTQDDRAKNRTSQKPRDS